MTTQTPYEILAPILLAKGWTGVIPLPPGKKIPPPVGTTGHFGKDPTSPEIAAWIKDKKYNGGVPVGNIALRLPPDVIGLDVDHYGEKTGGRTVAECEARWGPLRPTWRITSRSDGISGIRLARVPPGLYYVGELTGGGVEVIQRHHRFVVVPGSVHPKTGDIYVLYGPDGNPLPATKFPRPEDLPALPDEWVQGLSRDAQQRTSRVHLGGRTTRSGARTEPGDAGAWLDALPGADGEPCRLTLDTLAKALVPPEGSRYDHMNRSVLRVVRTGEEGHPGVNAALRAVRTEYVAAVADTRPEDVADREFDRSLIGACELVAAEPTTAVPTGDPCLVGAGPSRNGQAGTDSQPASAPTARITLNQAHDVFVRWMGKEYDLGALDAVLAVAASERLGGDPVWLLVISGSGNAKTETVISLAGIGAHIESTISSAGALLSGTGRKERAKDATGGLLRRIGDRGVLVLKDFTSIMSLERNARAEVLAALREVHDGYWSRSLGTDGGQTLRWEGRLVLVGASTTAYDVHHGVIAAMGDRFALLRTDSTTGRDAATRQAMRNIDHEKQMRTELAAAVAGVMAGIDLSAERVALTDDSTEALLQAADLVTLARTAVERDTRGEITEAHAPEMPTRFAKMLGQIMRGALALGIDQAGALAIAVRVAADTVPPPRLELLRTLLAEPLSTVTDLTKKLQRPRNTVRRTVDALHALRLVTYEEESYTKRSGEPGNSWRYQLADRINPEVLSGNPSGKVGRGRGEREGDSEERPGEACLPVGPHISGQTSGARNGHAAPDFPRNSPSQPSRSSRNGPGGPGPLALCSCGAIAEASQDTCWRCAG